MSRSARGAFRSVKNYAMGYTDVQIKVRECTSNDPWSPPGHLLIEIAESTQNPHELLEIMEIIDKRLNDHGKNWRHVFKSLALVEYLLNMGSENVVEYVKENLYLVRTLREFVYVDDEGRDHGMNVRAKAKEITTLLSDESKLREARKNRDAYKPLFLQNHPSNPLQRRTSFSSDSPHHHHHHRMAHQDHPRRSSTASENDADLQRALQESRREYERSQQQQQQTRSLSSRDKLNYLASSAEAGTGASGAAAAAMGREEEEEEEDFKRAIELSKQEHERRMKFEMEKQRVMEATATAGGFGQGLFGTGWTEMGSWGQGAAESTVGGARGSGMGASPFEVRKGMGVVGGGTFSQTPAGFSMLQQQQQQQQQQPQPYVSGAGGALALLPAPPSMDLFSTSSTHSTPPFGPTHPSPHPNPFTLPATTTAAMTTSTSTPSSLSASSPVWNTNPNPNATNPRVEVFNPASALASVVKNSEAIDPFARLASGRSGVGTAGNPFSTASGTNVAAGTSTTTTTTGIATTGAAARGVPPSTSGLGSGGMSLQAHALAAFNNNTTNTGGTAAAGGGGGGGGRGRSVSPVPARPFLPPAAPASSSSLYSLSTPSGRPLVDLDDIGTGSLLPPPPHTHPSSSASSVPQTLSLVPAAAAPTPPLAPNSLALPPSSSLSIMSSTCTSSSSSPNLAAAAVLGGTGPSTTTVLPGGAQPVLQRSVKRGNPFHAVNVSPWSGQGHEPSLDELALRAGAGVSSVPSASVLQQQQQHQQQQLQMQQGLLHQPPVLRQQPPSFTTSTTTNTSTTTASLHLLDQQQQQHPYPPSVPAALPPTTEWAPPLQPLQPLQQQQGRSSPSASAGRNPFS